jgi:hypothetical protein
VAESGLDSPERLKGTGSIDPQLSEEFSITRCKPHRDVARGCRVPKDLAAHFCARKAGAGSARFWFACSGFPAQDEQNRQIGRQA